MKEIRRAMGIDWKTGGRQIRRQTRAAQTGAETDTRRALWLSRSEATLLLTLSAASVATPDSGEEALFARLRSHLRQF